MEKENKYGKIGEVYKQVTNTVKGFITSPSKRKVGYLAGASILAYLKHNYGADSDIFQILFTSQYWGSVVAEVISFRYRRDMYWKHTKLFDGTPIESYLNDYTGKKVLRKDPEGLVSKYEELTLQKENIESGLSKLIAQTLQNLGYGDLVNRMESNYTPIRERIALEHMKGKERKIYDNLKSQLSRVKKEMAKVEEKLKGIIEAEKERFEKQPWYKRYVEKVLDSPAAGILVGNGSAILSLYF